MSTARLNLRLDRLPKAHAGLLLDKFYDQKPGAGLSKREREKRKADNWTLLERRPLADPAYRLAFARWRALLEPPPPHRLLLVGVVLGRLAIGLGAESIAGNGLRLHHTYGTPLIPASSLKGVLRRFVPNEPRRYRDFLFGPLQQKGQPRIVERRGAALFYDAWWVPSAQSGLSLDVLTVHHQPYYQDQAPPTDFDMPVPVHFLTVTGAFLFAIDAPNPKWKAFLEQLLKHVLGRHGIGAKCSAGYGRLAFP